MIVDDPTTLAEAKAAFAAYETALVTNDVEALDGFFWRDSRALRYGAGENLYGHAAIAAFRASRPSAGLSRELERTVITSFGRDFATASTLFRRPGAPGKVGRQTQSWARLPEGWRIVAAHVSIIDDPTG
ncbi:MAG: oxalurate catabolism protein HpxZ [Janthinobacterium lividum]